MYSDAAAAAYDGGVDEEEAGSHLSYPLMMMLLAVPQRLLLTGAVAVDD